MFIPKESRKWTNWLDTDFQMTTTQEWDWRAEIFREADKWVETDFLTIFMVAVIHCSDGLCQMSKVRDWWCLKKSCVYKKLSLKNENTVLLVFIFIFVYLLTTCDYYLKKQAKPLHTERVRWGTPANNALCQICGPVGTESFVVYSRLMWLICYPLGRCYYTDYSFFVLKKKKKRFTEEIKSLLKKEQKRVRWGKEFKHLIGVSELGNLYGLYSPWDFPRMEYLKVTNQPLEAPSNK